MNAERRPRAEDGAHEIIGVIMVTIPLTAGFVACYVTRGKAGRR